MPIRAWSQRALCAVLAACCVLAHAAGDASPAQPSASAPSSGERIVRYTVVRQDTLIGFGRDLLADPQAWREVARLNKLANPNLVRPGQVLDIPARLMRSAPLAATLVSVEGGVQLDGAPAAAGAEVLSGQTLVTAANGSAVVQLGDGSRVRLSPASEATLDEHERFVMKRPPRTTSAATSGAAADARADGRADDGWFAGAMRLVSGSIEVFATKVLRAKPLEVRTPTAVVGVRGTEFRVHQDGQLDTATVTETLEGRVHVEPLGRPIAPGAAVDVNAGFGAAAAPAEAPIVRELLPAPDLGVVPALFERPLVRFGLPGESRPLRVQVAVDNAFDRIVLDQRVEPAAEVRITGLDDGTWHLRARRIDDIGIQGRDAAREFVLKARPEPPATVAPRPNAKLSVGEVTLAWAENVEASRYELQIAHDEGFTQLDITQTVSGAGTRVQLDREGFYQWRLASVRGESDRGPWSDAQRFELRPQPSAPNSAMDDKTLQFNWGGRAGDRQQVELARDINFTNIVARDELQTTAWTLPTPGPGTYYFRYRSIEPDEFVSAWSSTLKLEVPRDWRYIWLLLLPLLGAL